MLNYIERILDYLDKNEIDYRLESNHCCGYIFYLLDGSVYPRRYFDYELEGIKETVYEETVEHQIQRAINRELVKDWKHRIESPDIVTLFKEVAEFLKIQTPH